MSDIYRVSSILVLCVAGNLHADVKLIHELLDEQIESVFHTSNVSTKGDLNFAILTGKHDAKSMDPSVSTLGNAFITYKNSAKGIGYGAEVGFKIRSGTVKGGRAIVDTANLHITHDYLGTFKLGWTESAAYLFNSTSRNILMGYKGFECSDKGLEYFYYYPTDAITNSAPKYDNKAIKFVWLSPTYKGFSAGLSYAPNDRFQNPFKTNHLREDDFLNSRCGFNTTADFHRNVITAAVAYEYGLSDAFHYRLSLQYWHGSTDTYLKNHKLRNLRAYNVGFDIGYGKFNSSLNYMDNGKSDTATQYANNDNIRFDASKNYSVNDAFVGIRPGADGGKVYRVAMSYAWGKLKTSLGYLHSKVKLSDNENIRHHTVSVAAQYDFDRAIGVFLEYDYLKTYTCDRARIYDKAVYRKDRTNNRGNIFITGIKINL